MITLVIRINNRLFKRNLERKGHYSSGQGKKQSKQKDHWPQPIELDAAYRKPLASKEEMDQHCKGKLCFKCGKEGHIANFYRKGRNSKP